MHILGVATLAATNGVICVILFALLAALVGESFPGVYGQFFGARQQDISDEIAVSRSALRRGRGRWVSRGGGTRRHTDRGAGPIEAPRKDRCA
jgi:hypothetical protein